MTTPDARTLPTVQVRRTWGAAWTAVPNLYAEKIEVAVQPATPRATFRLRYGSASVAGAAFAAIDRVDLVDQFVLVRTRWTATAAAETLFVGIIDADSDRRGGSAIDVPTGTQTLTASGLERLLARTPIDGAVTDAGRQTRPLPFNLPGPMNAVTGNRSTRRVQDAYVHSSDGELWTARDVVEHLLNHFAPPLNFKLGGTVGNLEHVVTTWGPFDNLLDALKTLIDRRRGMTFFVDFRSGNHPIVRVVSCFDGAVAQGKLRLAPNSDLFNADLDAEDGAVEDVTVRTSSAHRYTRVVAVGRPMVVCGTVSVNSGSLVQGWEAADEKEYVDAPDDETRKREKFARVYTTFVMSDPATFDKIPGLDAGARIPAVAADGSLDQTRTAKLFLHGRSLLPLLPLRAGEDYSVRTLKRVRPKPSKKPFLPPMVILTLTTGETARWIVADRARDPANDDGDAPLPNFPLRLLTGEPGFQLPHWPNHQLAAGSFTKENTDYPPVVSQNAILATVAVETDEMLRVELPIDANAPIPRTLRIEVPGAELWIVLPGTILDVHGDTYTPAPGLQELRNDRDRLRAAAELARTWYGRERLAVAYTLRRLDGSAVGRVGHMLRDLTASTKRLAIRTIVTRVSIDLTGHHRTTVETDFSELDFGLMTAPRRGAGGIGRSSMMSAESLAVRTPSAGPVDSKLIVRITSYAASNTPARNRWVYAWAQQTKTLAGAGGWTTLSGGRTGTTTKNYALNLAEDMNTAKGTSPPNLQGTGVDLDAVDVPAAMDMQPLPVGRLVSIRRVPKSLQLAETTEWYFEASNVLDGPCD